MTNIAAHVIKKLGGPQVVARICGVDLSRVHRWTYPKERGGTGGAIPAWHQVALLGYAIENNIDLTAADFFPQPEKGPEVEAIAAPPPSTPAPEAADRPKTAPTPRAHSPGARQPAPISGPPSTALDGVLLQLALDGVVDPAKAPRVPITLWYPPGSAKGELLPDTVAPPMDGRIRRWEPDGKTDWKLVFDSHEPVPQQGEAA